MIVAVPLGIDLLAKGIALAFAAPKIYKVGKAVGAVLDAQKKVEQEQKKKNS